MATLTLTEAQNGAEINLHVGDTVDIRLSENSAAGYRWTPLSLDRTRVALIDQRYQATSAAVGSAGTAILTLSATRPGNTRVELVKSRPWEPAESSTDRFSVDLVIAE